MKRFFDFSIAALVLILFFPVLLVTALLVYFKLGKPIFFIQTRPGFQGKLYNICKFRTMKDAVDASGTPLSDEERLTPFGKLLRSTSIDELPALWNVLKGELSLVGPRPLLVEYLPLYNSEQARRHDVKPGITGWAQVNGRNTISWEKKFKLDVWYVENHSFFLDLKILLLTARKVFIRSDISHEGHSTMPFFTGSDNSS